MNLDEIELREVKKSDIEFLFNLRLRTMNPHLIRAGIKPDNEVHQSRILDHFDDIRIIEINNIKIGMVKFYQTDSELVLSQIQLEAEYQRLGIGKKIISQIIQTSKEKQLPIKLRVLKANPAFRLYRRLGFRVIEENKTAYTFLFLV